MQQEEALASKGVAASMGKGPGPLVPGEIIQGSRELKYVGIPQIQIVILKEKHTKRNFDFRRWEGCETKIYFRKYFPSAGVFLFACF